MQNRTPSKSKTGCLIAAIIVGGVALILVLIFVGLGSCAILLSKSSSYTTPAPTMPIEEFKASCNQLDYDKLARLPNENKGKNVFFTGEVIQVMDDEYRIAIWDEELEAGDSNKIVYVIYHAIENEPRILEGDTVQVYGTSKGLKAYTTVLGQRIEIPLIDARIIDIQKE